MAATEGTKIAATSAADSLDLLESIINMVCTSVYFVDIDLGKQTKLSQMRWVFYCC